MCASAKRSQCALTMARTRERPLSCTPLHAMYACSHQSGFSAPAFFRTRRPVPSPPVRIDLVAATANSLKVQWALKDGEVWRISLDARALIRFLLCPGWFRSRLCARVPLIVRVCLAVGCDQRGEQAHQ